MADVEKVIKGLECAIGIRGRKNCDDCPYDNGFNCLGYNIVMRDTLELLKEQQKEIEKRTAEATAYAELLIKYGHEFT